MECNPKIPWLGLRFGFRVLVSGEIDPYNRHGCTQEKETNLTMPLKVIFIAWNLFLDRDAFLAADSNPQVKLQWWNDRDDGVSLLHSPIQMWRALFYFLIH